VVQDDKSVQTEPKPKKAWLLPTIFATFIVGTIVFLVIIDSIYAPEPGNPAALQDAADK
jgi:hypothetical protein